MIEFVGISRRFPGVQALSDVSFSVRAGECHALLGENGAGKSTLGKILAGLIRPDSGSIRLHGQLVEFASPHDALAAGVGIVHQELAFCPNLTVAENLCLAALPSRWGRLDRSALRERARRLLEPIGLKLDVDLRVEKLSLGEEQMLQIAAAVGLGARVLVFDEPTSSLARAETERLFDLIRQLRRSGTTMLYVSHRLEEIFELCQTVTVLRDGQHIATQPIESLTTERLVEQMVGRSLLSTREPEPVATDAPVVLQLRGWQWMDHATPLDLQLRRGEIVGLAGLVGAGRTELLESLYGLRAVPVGESNLPGVNSPRDALQRGVSLIPEDRKRCGLVLPMSVTRNLSLPLLDRFRGAGDWLRRGAERAFALRSQQDFRIKTDRLDTAVVHLSGGNQQKVVLAKGVASGKTLLLVDEPTRGVDVGAKQEIHELLIRLAAEGAAILVASSELPELFALAHRILVLRNGTVVCEQVRSEFSAQEIGRAMTGA